MFTGLIESVSPIKAIEATKVGKRLSIPLGFLAEDTSLGDSICVSGVCLTVSRLENDLATFDVITETLRVTTLGNLQNGERVNLERAMKADGRFGGHFVQGHVDGIATVDDIQQRADNYTLWITAESQQMQLMMVKGSVTIDGVSLTIVHVEEKRFSVSLIPTTLQETTLADRKKGDQINLEADIIGKWINQRLDAVLNNQKEKNLTLEKLQKQGFA
jgi:riboflavin synthase